MRLTDTHCHLYFRQYKNDLDEVINRAEGAGLERILVPGVDLETSRLSIQLAETYELVYAAVGVHPNSGLSWKNNTISELKNLASHPKVVAIGEIGLDYYRQQSPKDHQKLILSEQLNLAAEIELPVILHVRNQSEKDRECISELLDILENWVRSDSVAGKETYQPGVIHSFSGNVEESTRAIQVGFYLGIVGFVTYKNSGNIHDVIKNCGLDRLLVETDGPFITPHPYRGKRNEPAHVRYIVDKIGSVVGLPSKQIADISFSNAGNLFFWE